MRTVAPSPALDRQRRHARTVWYFGYLAVVLAGMAIAVIAMRRFNTPYLGVSLALIGAILIGWVVRPRATLALVVFLTAISDLVTVSWFPFVKNLSSRESISFLSDSVVFSPLEVTLYAGAILSMMRHYAEYGTPIARSAIHRAMIVFTGFAVFGLARGVSAGGDLRIAILESRAIFYLPLIAIIVANEFTTRRQLRAPLAALILGVVVQSFLSIYYLNQLEIAERESLESLNEHGSALGQNVVIVTLIAAYIFQVKNRTLRWSLGAAAVPTLIVFFVSERRAGVAALLIAGVFLALALYQRRPRAFWVIVPFVTVAILGYTFALWNSTSSFAFPAQAVKGIIAPNSVSAKDRQSDVYRMVEAFDINFTIRTDPLLGIGFGRRFYQVVRLPNIAQFDLNLFVTHNSILYMWMKTGFFGFVAMFYLFAKTLMLGGDRVRRIVNGPDLLVALYGVTFVGMFAVYTWVDISWDARNMVFLGLAVAICGRELTPEEDRFQVPAARARAPGTDLATTAPDEGSGPSGSSESVGSSPGSGGDERPVREPV